MALQVEGQCDDSNDCFTAINDGVTRFCFETAAFSNLTFFCDCSVWFGWKGEKCNEESIALNFHRFVVIFFIIWTFLLFIVSLRSVILNFMIGTLPNKERDPIVYTAIFILLTTLLMCIYSILRLPPLFNSNLFEVVIYKGVTGDDTIQLASNTGVFSNYLYITCISFFIFSTLFLMLSWDKAVVKVARFQNDKQRNNAKKWGFRLKAFGIFYGLINIIFFCFELLFASAVLLLLVSIAVTIFCIVVSYKFVKTLRSLVDNTENNKVYMITSLVTKVAKITVICFILISICSLVYYITLVQIDETIKPGDANIALYARDLGTAVALFLITVNAWYVNSVTEGAVLADDYPKLCCIFQFWDKKNTQFLPGETEVEDDVEKKENEQTSVALNSNLLKKDKTKEGVQLKL